MRGSSEGNSGEEVKDKQYNQPSDEILGDSILSEDPSEREVIAKLWVGVVILGVVELFGVVLLINGYIWLSISIAIAPMLFLIYLLIFTKKGWKTMQQLIDEIENYQQGNPNKSNPKQICSGCGWQNPNGNRFCHDCGSRLSKEE